MQSTAQKGDISVKVTEEVKDEIIVHIKQAKNKKKQVEIEADLHGLSKGQVKEIMKERGLSLRVLNGENFLKKHDELVTQDIITPVEDIPVIEGTEAESKEWADLAIPPYYTEPNFGPLPESSEKEENAADSPRDIKDVNPEDALIVGTHILEDEKIFEAIQKKIEKMKARRRNLVAEIEAIDTCLRKYAHFYEDLYDDIQKEGVEI